MRQQNIERMKAILEELAAKGPKAPAKKESAPKAKSKSKEEAPQEKPVEKEVVAVED